MSATFVRMYDGRMTIEHQYMLVEDENQGKRVSGFGWEDRTHTCKTD